MGDQARTAIQRDPEEELEAMRLAQLPSKLLQRIMELQVGTAKSLFEEGVANAKARPPSRIRAEALNLRTTYAQSTTEKMLACCAREIAEITKTQAEAGKMVSEQLTGGGQDMFESLQKMFKGMPIGDNNALFDPERPWTPPVPPTSR